MTRTVFKILVLGKAKVGKTALINQFLHRQFLTEYKPTVDEHHWVEFECEAGQFTLQIYDTAGNGEYPAMIDLYIKQLDAFMLVFSPDVESSLNEIKNRLNWIQNSKEKSRRPIVIVANKSDKNDLSREKFDELCKFFSPLPFLEANAKNFFSVENVFKLLMTQTRNVPELNALKKRRQSMPVNSSQKGLIEFPDGSPKYKEERSQSCIIT